MALIEQAKGFPVLVYLSGLECRVVLEGGQKNGYMALLLIGKVQVRQETGKLLRPVDVPPESVFGHARFFDDFLVGSPKV
ncbi:MAG TPA: hypothetical protein VD811_01400 [Desulfuromonadales bacterium]|nr:hypothetical protein [Desulfuromonadales bacterium]